MKKERFPIDLIAARTQKGLSQKDLAEAIGVSERSISLWERGKVIPRMGIRMTLAQFLLGVDQRDWFLFDDELPQDGVETKSQSANEAAILQNHLQKALLEANVSESLKSNVSKALEVLPELMDY